ncbi:MAG: type III-A CRISPR-associated protein Csm2 [Ignavibacteria bacterium]|jgi:CRISPR-associated protein Csm2|nr:type III-A CRISPR-associated protein Csm2 [Ignavibacteria bacterium]MDH7527252.1 type III-A CRISPR-associated protein Csm2 [Ignavibacteria bacterium]
MNGNPQLVRPLYNMTAQQIDAYCNDRGRQFARSVTTSQLRNVFSKIVSIRTFYNNPNVSDFNTFINKLKRDITLLKPRLAYATGRDNNLKDFYRDMVTLIDETINSIDSELSSQKTEQFKLLSIDNFFSIVEGFVAYHKYYGGK